MHRAVVEDHVAGGLGDAGFEGGERELVVLVLSCEVGVVFHCRQGFGGGDCWELRLIAFFVDFLLT